MILSMYDLQVRIDKKSYQLITLFFTLLQSSGK